MKNTFGAFIRSKRLEKSISLRQFADIIRISVAKAVDSSASTTTYYYYDFEGNLTGEYRQTEGGDLSYFLSYDSDGNKVEKTSINGQTKTITTRTDEDGKSYVSNDGVTAKTTTDDFGRTTQVKTSRGESDNL